MLEHALYGYEFGTWNTYSDHGKPRIIGGSWFTDSISRIDLRRVAVWNNLLKQLKLVVTPDVVAAYCLATNQGQLFYGYADADKCKANISWLGRYGDPLSGFYAMNAGSNFDPGDYCVSAKTSFPAELVEMTKDYLFYRLGSFLNVINEVTGWRRIVSRGDPLPSRVVNAFEGWNDIGGLADSFARDVVALHASVIPDVVACCNTAISPTETPPSLRWDPSTWMTSDRVRCPANNGSDDDARSIVRINAVQAAKIESFVCKARDFYYELMTAINDQKTEVVTRMLETFCLCVDINLYVKACTLGDYYGLNVLQLPTIDEANLMLLKSKKDDINKCPTWTNISISDLSSLVKLTPAGAVVLGDILEKNSYSDCNWYAVRNTLENSKADEYACVATFLIQEALFQTNVRHTCTNELDMFKRNGGMQDDRRR